MKYYKKRKDSKLYYKVVIEQCYEKENDAYDILNVDSSASTEEISQSYDNIVEELEAKIKNCNNNACQKRTLVQVLTKVNNAWAIIRDNRLKAPYDKYRNSFITSLIKKPINYTVKIEQYYNPDFDYCDILKITESTKNYEKKFDNAICNIKDSLDKEEDNALLNPSLNETLNNLYEGWNIFRDETLKNAYFEARNEYKKSIKIGSGKMTNTDISEDLDKDIEEDIIKDYENENTNTSKKKVTKSEDGKKVAKAAVAGLLVGTGIITASYFLQSCGKKEYDKIVKPNSKSFTEHFIEDTDLTTNVEEATIETDVIDEEEIIQNKATNIYNGFVASNVNNITVEELENEIRFLNGSYSASTTEESYEMLNNVLSTWATYGSNLLQGASFAGGVVSENGVHYTVTPVEMLPNTSEHYNFMVETSRLWTNVLTAQDIDSKRYAAIEYLKQATDLKLGLLVDDTNTRLGYMDLEPNEGFIYGFMFHIAYPHIVSALGEDYTIPIQDNNGDTVYFGIQKTWEFYNPQCNDNDDELNPWYHFANELVEQNIIENGLILRPQTNN